MAKSLKQSFDEKWMPLTECSCWLWTASVRKGDYGQIVDGTRPRVATHVALEIYKGTKIPYGTLVCHKCDHPWCVNPDHLFIGDAMVNSLDSRSKGRNRNRLGENNTQSKLSRDIVLKIRSTPGTCREVAKQFSVHNTTVSRIRRKANWGWLNESGERT